MGERGIDTTDDAGTSETESVCSTTSTAADTVMVDAPARMRLARATLELVGLEEA